MGQDSEAPYVEPPSEVVDRAESDDADVFVVKKGFISVTPIHVDLTRRDAMANVTAALETLN